MAGLKLIGESTTRKSTAAEDELHKAIIAGTATSAQYAAAGSSMPTSKGGTGRESGSVPTPVKALPIPFNPKAVPGAAPGTPQATLTTQAGNTTAGDVGNIWDINNNMYRDLQGNLKFIMQANGAYTQNPLYNSGTIKLENKPAEQPKTILDMTKDIPVLGKTLEILASTKTTAILAGVLTTLPLISSAIAAVTAKTASSIILGSEVSSAAAGTLITKSATGVMTGTITNTVTAAKTASFFSMLAKAAKNPYIVLGAIGGYAFSTNLAMNERGDAATALQIALGTAIKNGDKAGAKELQDMINDITEPSIMNTLKLVAPIINYPIAAITKWVATRKAASTMMGTFEQQTKKAEEEKAAEVAETEKWDKIAADRAAAKVEEQRQSDARYALIQKNAATAKAQERKADEKYWADISKKEEAKAEENRKQDEAYYQAIETKKAEQKAEQRAADEKYYAEIAAKNAAKKPDVTIPVTTPISGAKPTPTPAAPTPVKALPIPFNPKTPAPTPAAPTDTTDWAKVASDKAAASAKETADYEASQKRIIDAWNKAKEENRKADVEYWAEQRLLSEEAARKKRAEDEIYWAMIKKKREEEAKSKLTFGIL